MKTWHLFAWLIVTAVIYYFVGKLILFFVACYFLFRFWLWLGINHPAICWFLIGFFRGLR